MAKSAERCLLRRVQQRLSALSRVWNPQVQPQAFMPVASSARYPNIPVARHSALLGGAGIAWVSGNRISIAGAVQAEALQLPKPGLGYANFFSQILQNKPPFIVAILSFQDLAVHLRGKAAYWKIDQILLRKKPQINLTCQVARPLISLAELDLHSFNWTLSQGHVRHQTRLFHVTGWLDQHTCSEDALLRLSEFLIQAGYGTQSLGAPMVHCVAGVGRTGTLLAALHMLLQPEIGLIQVIQDIRKSRNCWMIQTDSQLLTLIRLAQHLGCPICF